MLVLASASPRRRELLRLIAPEAPCAGAQPAEPNLEDLYLSVFQEGSGK